MLCGSYVGELVGFLAEATLNFIMELVLWLGYFGILLVMVVESIIVPLPSEAVLPFAGFLVYQGKLDFLLTLFAATLGATVSAVAAYYIGLLGGVPLMRRVGRYMFISDRELDRNERFFKQHGEGAVFFGRMIPGVRSVISIPAGMGKMRLTRFTLFTFFGSMTWCFALIYAGFALGPHWTAIIGFIGQFELLIIAFLAVLLTLYIADRRGWVRLRRLKVIHQGDSGNFKALSPTASSSMSLRTYASKSVRYLSLVG